MTLDQLKQTIKAKAAREVRTDGTPYTDSDIDRILADAGVERA